jgi:RNA polymerase sigma-70 factor (sigma-E family)
MPDRGQLVPRLTADESGTQIFAGDRQPPAAGRISIYVTASPESVQAPGQEMTTLYETHALGLLRLAYVMLGDRPAAEDVVQEAFLGLYRRWNKLRDRASAPAYLRSSVLNGCRMALRSRSRRDDRKPDDLPWESAEATTLVSEEQRQLLVALRALPPRQREALVLRYYLDLSEEEIAKSMGIRPGTVKSTASRALAALGRSMKEYS